MISLEELLDILPVGVWLLDANFRVADVNSTIEEFFCIQRENVLGQDKRKLVNEVIFKIFEDGENFRCRILATYNNNTYIERFVCHVLPSEGRKQRWLEHTSAPILKGLYKGGRIEMYSDITERILAEQEIDWIFNNTMKLQEKEKFRIASNLHDGLGQSVLAIKFSLERLRKSLENHPDTLKSEVNELNKIIAWVERMTCEVSQISSNIMPSMLGPLGLEETLISLRDQYSSLYGVEINYESFGFTGKRLSEVMEVAIFRVFQEGLNNIIKHASAKYVDLKLVYSYPKILISITDDGIGFNPDDKIYLGTGLKLMKQRISELNGTIKIVSKINQGTAIRVEIPLIEKDHDNV
jgi:PAS domain S-box-containing protein